MRSPALAFKSILITILGASLSAGACAAQSTGAPSASPEFTARQLVLPLQFRIEAQSSSGQRFQVVMSNDQSWMAVLEMGGQVWMATERNCSAFRAALDAFGRLPPLSPGPYDLRNNPQPRQFGPRTPHGEFWTLRLAGFAPDHTDIDMEISGSQGPYPQWASETVSAIKACGNLES